MIDEPNQSLHRNLLPSLPMRMSRTTELWIRCQHLIPAAVGKLGRSIKKTTMKKTTHIIITSLILFLCSCGGSGKTPNSDFEGRLQAALAVDETGQRDEALKIVATDSANAGNGTVCLEAVSKVTSPYRRDDLAEDCAIRLVKAGESTSATEVANLINDAGRRSEVNKKIATNN
ncbi:MAG: hypothetical protein KDA80_12450 [Planctomycetaceae bacterium]|nr:hypothetical protein [Planctomycetaceae bacterium]